MAKSPAQRKREQRARDKLRIESPDLYAMTVKPVLILGVGVNDADYPATRSSVVNGKKKIVWRCPFYRDWTAMIMRCYSSQFHERNPTYIGCSVDPEWLVFSVFKRWMESQLWEGMQLDKDVLAPGNRVYSPDTCAFISGALNRFTNDVRSARGELPIGVLPCSKEGRFLAHCRNPFTGKKEWLGKFSCAQSAHDAWRARKHEHACTYADQQADPRVAIALRSRYAPLPAC